MTLAERALAILEKKFPPKRWCLACGSGSKSLQEQLYYIPGGFNGMLGMEGIRREAPMLLLTCDGCGLTEFFSPIALGLIDQDGKEVPE